MASANRSAKVIARQQLWVWHWVMAACFLLLFAGGIYMANLPRGVPQLPFLIDLHKSFGILVMILLSIRIGLLLRVLASEQWVTKKQKTRSRLRTTALHTALYGFMMVVPLSGYGYSSLAGSEVSLFGLQLPLIVAPNEALIGLGGTTHFWLAYSFLSLIGLHIIMQRRFLQSFWKRIVRRV